MNSGIPFIKIADRVEVTVDLIADRVSGPPLVFNQSSDKAKFQNFQGAAARCSLPTRQNRGDCSRNYLFCLLFLNTVTSDSCSDIQSRVYGILHRSDGGHNLRTEFKAKRETENDLGHH